MKYFWTMCLFLAAASVLSACSQGSSVSAASSSQRITEFTPFNPLTGQPLTAADITPALLSENAPVDDTPVGQLQQINAQTSGVSDSGETLQRVQTFFLLGYDPNGEYNSNLSASCHFDNVSQIIQNSYSTAGLASDLQNWDNQCDAQLSRYHTNNIATVLQFANVNYDLTQNKIEKLQFNLDDSTVIKGLLAMKPGKRPLVIFKTGVYSDASDNTDGVMRNFYMHLFEETPFNILMLGNITGEEAIKDNHSMSMGGFDEGREIVKVAQLMADDPQYASQITDIHVVGVSLGSNGALFSSLYSSYEPEGLSKIKSAIALCPVVNLQPTIQSVFNFNTVRGIFYYILTSQTLHDVYGYVPTLQKLLPNTPIWSDQSMYNAVTQGALNYYQTQTSAQPWDMQPFNGQRVQAMSDLWYNNNFLNFTSDVTTPTLVVYAKDDFLVKPDINSQSLVAQLQNNSNPNIGVLGFQHGSHCAFNVGEGWPTLSALIRSYVLKHSSYQAANLQDKVLPLDTSNLPALSETQTITMTTFRTQSGKDDLAANVVLFNADAETNSGSPCGNYDSNKAPDECYQTQTIHAHLSDFSSIGMSIPENDFQSQRLNRWLNTHAVLLNANSDLALSQSSWPTQIRFHGNCEISP